jgi:CheY-like chemotaxis protein
MMSVTDTGHGMDPETAKRVFEPFFTTKEVGKGTGLGLATAHGIIEQSGGTMSVQTAPGKGATFRIYLPRTQDTEQVETTGAPVARGKATGLVLLVEDEAPLRKLLHRALAAAGHAVIEAASGEEALVRARQQPIDLVLTDVIMPGMSGPELVARLSASRPEMIVLYMSGYDRKLIDEKSFQEAAAFLPKPFTPQALLARVSELLSVEARRDSDLAS